MTLKRLSECVCGFASTFGKVIGREGAELVIEHRRHTRRVLWNRRAVSIGEWVRVFGACKGEAIESQVVQSLEGIDIALFERVCEEAREFARVYREVIGDSSSGVL
jgi:hypothetical protein